MLQDWASDEETAAYDGETEAEKVRAHLDELKEREARRRDYQRQLISRLATLNARSELSGAELKLRAKSVTYD